MVDGSFYTLPILSFLLKVIFKCTKINQNIYSMRGKESRGGMELRMSRREVNLCYMTTLF